MNTYTSIIPAEMTASEIRNLCAELLTAKNWKQPNAEVMLESGERKVIPTSKLEYYQGFHRVETGGINSKTGRPSAKEFALAQIAPYFVDPTTCGMLNQQCKYLTTDGKMCVVGKNMNETALKFWGSTQANISVLFDNATQEQLFKPEVIGILTNTQWVILQKIHDCIAFDNECDIRMNIEDLNLFSLQELKDYSEKLKSLSPA